VHSLARMLTIMALAFSQCVVATEQKDEMFPRLGQLASDTNVPWLQEFWMLGRYHGQFHLADGESQDSHDLEHRRLRLGFQARMFFGPHSQALFPAAMLLAPD
jgi:hypothetical protein